MASRYRLRMPDHTWRDLAYNDGGPTSPGRLMLKTYDGWYRHVWPSMNDGSAGPLFLMMPQNLDDPHGARAFNKDYPLVFGNGLDRIDQVYRADPLALTPEKPVWRGYLGTDRWNGPASHVNARNAQNPPFNILPVFTTLGMDFLTHNLDFYGATTSWVEVTSYAATTTVDPPPPIIYEGIPIDRFSAWGTVWLLYDLKVYRRWAQRYLQDNFPDMRIVGAHVQFRVVGKSYQYDPTQDLDHQVSIFNRPLGGIGLSTAEPTDLIHPLDPETGLPTPMFGIANVDDATEYTPIAAFNIASLHYLWDNGIAQAEASGATFPDYRTMSALTWYDLTARDMDKDYLTFEFRMPRILETAGESAQFLTYEYLFHSRQATMGVEPRFFFHLDH